MQPTNMLGSNGLEGFLSQGTHRALRLATDFPSTISASGHCSCKRPRLHVSCLAKSGQAAVPVSQYH